MTEVAKEKTMYEAGDIFVYENAVYACASTRQMRNLGADLCRMIYDHSTRGPLRIDCAFIGNMQFCKSTTCRGRIFVKVSHSAGPENSNSELRIRKLQMPMGA